MLPILRPNCRLPPFASCELFLTMVCLFNAAFFGFRSMESVECLRNGGATPQPRCLLACSYKRRVCAWPVACPAVRRAALHLTQYRLTFACADIASLCSPSPRSVLAVSPHIDRLTYVPVVQSDPRSRRSCSLAYWHERRPSFPPFALAIPLHLP